MKTDVFTDCMERALIHPPDYIISGEKCIVTTISPGYETILKDMLLSLKATGNVPDAQIVVFIINPNESCIKATQQFDAHVIKCDPIREVNINSKSVLYSAYEIIDCDKILYIDADVLVLDDLNPLFDAMDNVPPESIWAVKDFYFLWASKLKDIIIDEWNLYNGSYEDFGRLLTQIKDEPEFPFIINAGILAGRKLGWETLDKKLRALNNMPNWVDEKGKIREQFVVNLSLASLNNLIPMHIRYNLQLCSPRFLEFKQVDDKIVTYLHSSPFRLGFLKNIREWAYSIVNESDYISKYLNGRLSPDERNRIIYALNNNDNIDFLMVDVMNNLINNAELFDESFLRTNNLPVPDKSFRPIDKVRFNKELLSNHYTEYVIPEPIHSEQPIALLHFNGPDKSFNGTREYLINSMKTKEREVVAAHNHIDDVKFVISTHKNYQNTTLPKLLNSLIETNRIPPEDILVVSGGWDTYGREVKDGVEYRCVTHNSFDHNGLIEVVESGYYHPFWFVLHDTSEMGANFYNRLKDFNRDYEHISVCSYGALSMGMFRWDYLQETKNFIMSLKNCGKERAFLSEYMFLRMAYASTFENEYEKVIGTSDVYGQGTTRTIRYFPTIDIYKYQANTTHAGRVFNP